MSDNGPKDSLHGTQSALPCANGCGFFGSSANMNMCSKCFRETYKSSPPPAAPASPVASPAAAATTAATFPDPVPSTPSVPALPDKVVSPAPAVAPPAAPAPPATPAPADPEPRKIQKNISRCFSCRKKIGLTGFKCHCGYFYCSTHRYSDQHQCDFDYRALARAQIAKDNPVVVAPKIDKI